VPDVPLPPGLDVSEVGGVAQAVAALHPLVQWFSACTVVAGLAVWTLDASIPADHPATVARVEVVHWWMVAAGVVVAAMIFTNVSAWLAERQRTRSAHPPDLAPPAPKLVQADQGDTSAQGQEDSASATRTADHATVTHAPNTAAQVTSQATTPQK
jgi:hypothetical protein